MCSPGRLVVCWDTTPPAITLVAVAALYASSVAPGRRRAQAVGVLLGLLAGGFSGGDSASGTVAADSVLAVRFFVLLHKGSVVFSRHGYLLRLSGCNRSSGRVALLRRG